MGKIPILDRMRQHHRAERRGVQIDRLFVAPLQPCEQIEIGRGKPRPHQFDLVRILTPELRRGGLGKPRRNPDPHRAGDEFQQRPAAGLVQLVEPARQLFWEFGLAERAQRGDDFGQRRRRRVVVARSRLRLPSLHACSAWRGGVGGGGSIGRLGASMRARTRCATPHPRPLPTASRGEGRSPRVEWRRPHQRHRLGEIADIVIGQREQHGVGAGGDEVADQAGFCMFERQCPRQRGERIAAIGVLGLAKIGREQPQLVVAAGLVGEAVEQFGEAVHASASSPAEVASPSSSSP